MNVSKFFSDAFNLANIKVKISKDQLFRLESICSLKILQNDENIITQNTLADKLFFLINGEANFTVFNKNQLQKIATINSSFVPLGISGLNSPGRYASNIIVKKNSSFLSINLSDFYKFIEDEVELGVKLFSLILSRSTELLKASRGLINKESSSHLKVSKGIRYIVNQENLNAIKDSAFFSSMELNDLNKILSFFEIRQFKIDDKITIENSPNYGLFILLSGRIEATFTALHKKIEVQRSRTVVRPGVALSYSNGFSKLKNPYTLIATRDTAMFTLSNSSLKRLIKIYPDIALLLLKRQVWQIEKFRQSATGLTHYIDGDERNLLSNLLKMNGSKIPVDSKLYKAEASIKNKHTREYAINCIYEAGFKGNDVERSIAGLVMDALDGLERETRFFKQLNIVYKRVVSAKKNQDPSTLLRLSNADFIRAFDQVPYVIKGYENLPKNKKNIFIYNHLAAVESNQLANGHSFSIDSHFVSAKILIPKYNDSGQRIVRASRKNEYWRSEYYSRLSNIVVHTPESDKLEETPSEKKRRKESFFVDAQEAFNENRPLAIAPEGTSETPDNVTNKSPGPFKPGAFLLANSLDPKPMIIPIALANFDFPISKTVYSAVIKEGFYIDDFVDVNDSIALSGFLNEYRKKFRGYVEEAIELARNIETLPPKRKKELITNIGFVSPVEKEFEADVRELEIKMVEKTTAKKKVVLYGSSTFRLWSNPQNDLSLTNLINLGFGGSTLQSCRFFFDRLVGPHNPDIIFLYAGDNDIGNGKSYKNVVGEFNLFLDQVYEKLPLAKCFFISIKPSPYRSKYQNTIFKTNEEIAKLINNNSQWKFIDLYSFMIDKNGRPSDIFYDKDPLHMNSIGYSLLSKLMRDELN